MDEIGSDRVVFSINYLYDDVSDGENWRDSVLVEAVGVQVAYEAIGRTNSIQVLKVETMIDI